MSTTTPFDLKAISPETHPRYSKNLHEWVRKQIKCRGTVPMAFESAGDLYLGTGQDEGWHALARIERILMFGSKAHCVAFPRSYGFTEVVNFWESYLLIGRCAIDKKHKTFFIGDETRWEVTGDTRRCLWCGNHTQHLQRWTETVEQSAWVSDAPVEGGAK